MLAAATAEQSCSLNCSSRATSPPWFLVEALLLPPAGTSPAEAPASTVGCPVLPPTAPLPFLALSTATDNSVMREATACSLQTIVVFHSLAAPPLRKVVSETPLHCVCPYSTVYCKYKSYTRGDFNAVGNSILSLIKSYNFVLSLQFLVDSICVFL
jgi:hypothetical protein